jgi:uroporphyrinogen decarboxylase
MTKKERVIAAVRRKPVDRIPTTFRANKVLSELLMKHLGFEDPKDLAGNRERFLGELKADFWSSGTKVDKFSTFSPKYLGPPPQAPYVDDGTSFYKIGIRAKPGEMEGFGVSYPLVGVDPPLAGALSPSDIPKGFLMEKLELFDFGVMRNSYREVRVEDIENSGDDVVNVGSLSNHFMICCYLRGMEAFLMDMAFDSKMAERLTGEAGEFILEFNRRELGAVGRGTVYYGTWDDVCGQNGMLFSPALFKKHFLPTYRKLIAEVHSRGLFFGWHCCGSVHEVLPLMIDAGIDVFDVVQTSARGMEIENVHRLYGGDVCLHGAVDVQKDLVEKTPGGVRDVVRRIKDLWGDRGGMILAPSHETLPDAPLENVLAIYEAAAE